MRFKKYVKIEYLEIFKDVSKYLENILVALLNFVKIKDVDCSNALAGLEKKRVEMEEKRFLVIAKYSKIIGQCCGLNHENAVGQDVCSSWTTQYDGTGGSNSLRGMRMLFLSARLEVPLLGDRHDLVSIFCSCTLI